VANIVQEHCDPAKLEFVVREAITLSFLFFKATENLPHGVASADRVCKSAVVCAWEYVTGKAKLPDMAESLKDLSVNDL
jgi:hypothetical protein